MSGCAQVPFKYEAILNKRITYQPNLDVLETILREFQ